MHLRAQGYDPGPIDGILGPRTQRALAEWTANGNRPRGGGAQAAPPRRQAWFKPKRSSWQRHLYPEFNPMTDAARNVRLGQLDSSLPANLRRMRASEVPDEQWRNRFYGEVARRRTDALRSKSIGREMNAAADALAASSELMADAESAQFVRQLRTDAYRAIRDGGADPVALSEYRDGVFEAMEELGYRRLRRGSGGWGLTVNADRWLQPAQPKKDNSIWGKVKRTAGNVVGTGLDALSYLPNQLQDAYYASSFARDQGSGLGGQLSSFGFGLNPFGTNRYEQATETREQREELGLRSFGQNVTGQDSWYTSGLLDLAFQVGTDPLTGLSLGLSRAGLFGDIAGQSGIRARAGGMGMSARRFATTFPDEAVLAQRAGRTSALATTATGRSLDASLRQALAAAQEPEALRRALRGLSTEDAAAAVAAARRGGLDEGVQVLREAFVEGAWRPSLSLRRSLAAGITGSRAGAVSSGRFLGLGPTSIRRPDGGHALLERLAGRTTGFGAIGALATADAGRALDTALNTATRRAQTTTPDAWRQFVSADVADLSPFDRLARVFDSDAVQASPQAQTIVENEVNRLRSLPSPEGGARPSFDQLLASPQAETVLQKLETLEATLSGRLGRVAQDQAETFLRTAFTPGAIRGATGLSSRVARNVGETPTQTARKLAAAERATLARPAGPELVELDAQIAAASSALSALKNTPGLSLRRAEEHIEGLRSARERLAGLSAPETERLARRTLKAEQLATTESLSGLGIPVTAKKVEVTAANREFWQQRIVDNMPADVAEAFLDDLAKLRSNGNLAPLARRAEHLIANPTAMDEAVRLVRNDGLMAKAATEAVVESTALRSVASKVNVLRPAAKVALSIAESLPPSVVVFASSSNPSQSAAVRVRDVDRWLMAGGADRFTRESVSSIVGNLRTEQGLFDVVQSVLDTYARIEGIDPQTLRTMLASQRAKLQEGFVGRLDEAGNPVDELQTLAQRTEAVPLPNWDDVRRVVREARAAQGSISARAGLAMRHAVNPTLPFKGLFTGEDVRLLTALHSVHRAWKFGVVAGINPVAGIAGFALADGDLGDRLQGAAIGMGGLGIVRYLGRVVGIEERLRILATRGFRPTEWTPVFNQALRRRGVDIPMQSLGHVSSGGQILNFFDNRLLASTAPDWVALQSGDRRFLEGWRRIVNRQIHPESDELVRILLSRKAGMPEFATDELANAAIRDYFATNVGRIHLARVKAGINGPKNADEAIERARAFVDEMVPSPDLARLRLQAGAEGISRDVLRAERKAGRAPTAVHAQRTWVVPRSWADGYSSWRSLTDRFIFSGPTGRLNRRPMAEHIYREQYLALRNNGVSAERAARIADQIAVDRTNAIMFRVADESRFAKRVDLVFPFQQPREELIRVYGRIVVGNVGRTARLARLAAIGVNNGRENGVFRKDPLTGDYVMTVPGSALLSSLLGAAQPVPFQFRPQDMLFLNTAAPGTNIFPAPGGPAWIVGSRWFIDNHKDWFDRNFDSTIVNYLFPYGQSGKLGRPESARFWMAMFNSPAPWEFNSKPEQENELNRYNQMAYRMVYAEAVANGADPDTYEPDPQEVRRLVQAMFTTWAVVGSVFPAGSRPVDEWERSYQEARARFTRGSLLGEEVGFDYAGFLDAHPEFAPYLERRTEFIGEQDFEAWEESGDPDEDAALRDYFLRNRRQLSLGSFTEEFRQARTESRLWKDYLNIINGPFTVTRDSEIADFLADYPEFADKVQGRYLRDSELRRILALPRGQQDDALDQWRRRYDVSNNEFRRLRAEVAREGPLSPWAGARPTDQVRDDVERAHRGGANIEQYVATLPPAEQIRYWTSRRADLAYFGGQDSQAVLDDWTRYGRFISSVFTANPDLSSGGRDTDEELAEKAFDAIGRASANELYTRLDEVYAAINANKPVLDQLAQAKQWTEFWSLKARQDALYAERTAIYDGIRKNQNDQYLSWRTREDDVRAVVALVPGEYYRDWRNRAGEDFGEFFVPSAEQERYLDMTPDVRRAYVDDLVASLERQFADEDDGTRLHWSYLTRFQQDLLTANMPGDYVERWRQAPTDQERYEAERAAADKDGDGRPDNRRGEWNIGGATLGSGFGELAFAFEMFKQYDQRGGRTAPAGYQQYLNMPNDPVLRRDFLNKNPAVAEWIRLGPMANMPEVYRYMVADIMIRYGRWEGEVRTIEEITDLAFAREQLARWTRRPEGAQAPAAYDIWLNMPTGIEKARYIEAHPEIGEWLRLGPMANMPEEYREVVRDIMVRYGEWTQRNDPLGKVIQGYYDTPTFAREQYLQAHPELAAYWAATRSPEEARMSELTSQYFALPPSGRRLFLSANPELQTYFIEARTKRYERFLNRVAQYMGANPELFTEYLERQEDVLGELLNKFAEPAMVSEMPRLRDAEPTRRTSSGESGRQRAA